MAERKSFAYELKAAIGEGEIGVACRRRKTEDVISINYDCVPEPSREAFRKGLQDYMESLKAMHARVTLTKSLGKDTLRVIYVRGPSCDDARDLLQSMMVELVGDIANRRALHGG